MAAGYQKPLVLVYQEFERLSPSLGNPDLSACIIGPAFAIYTLEDDKAAIRAGFFEYDANFNVPVKRTGVQYPGVVTLTVAGGITPAYVMTFSNIIDFESIFNIKDGIPGVGEFWYQRENQNITLTYSEGVSTTRTQTIDLGVAKTPISNCLVLPVAIVGAGTTLNVISDAPNSVVTEIEINGIDFEAAGVTAGDILRIVTITPGIQEYQEFLVSDDPTGTVLYIDASSNDVRQGDTTAYTLALDGAFGSNALNHAGSYAYVYSADVNETAANSIIIQTSVAAADALTLGIINPNSGGSAFYTSATDSNFGTTDVVGGNYVIWDSSITAVDPTVYNIPNPDGIPGLQLVPNSTKVYFDEAVVITAGGIARVQGQTSFVPPTTIAVDEFWETSQDDIRAEFALDTAISIATTTIILDTELDLTDYFQVGNLYVIYEAGVGGEVFEIATAGINDTTKTLTATSNVGTVLDYTTDAIIYNAGFDTFSHDNINFELLGILEGDKFYLEFPTGTTGKKTYYKVASVAGETLTVSGIDGAATNDVFNGIRKDDGTPYLSLVAYSPGTITAAAPTITVFDDTDIVAGQRYRLSGVFGGAEVSEIVQVVTALANVLTLVDPVENSYLAGAILSDTYQFQTDAVTGFFSVLRGGLSSLTVTYRASDSLVDTDNSALLTFDSNNKALPNDLGFFTAHINIEPGDEVYIARTTTGSGDSGNTLNATFVKHRVFTIEKERLILTSPVSVPLDDRTTAAEVSEINDAVMFYVQKNGLDDMLLPIAGFIGDEDNTGAVSGYEEDADDFSVTINTASVAYDPRFIGVFQGDVPATGTFVTIDDEGVVNSDNTVKGNIVKGIVHIGSKSLRTDLQNKLITIFNTNEIEGKVGKVIPENPLAYGLFKCLQGAANGVAIKAYAIDSAAETGNAVSVAYQKALDFLTGTDEVYTLVPLTRITGILGAFKQHVETMSLPEKAGWRIVLINTELKDKNLELDKHGATSSLTTNVTFVDLGAADHRRFKDDNASFVSDGISPGMNLELYYDVEDFSFSPRVYTIDSVLSETQLEVVEVIVQKNGTAFAIGNQVIGNINYEITRDLDKTEQAEKISSFSSSFGSRRVYNMWPDVVEIDEVELPGYYLGCIVAGMISSLPAHQGFTRYGIPGVDVVVHSNDYFNEVQLDIIAGGGTYVFVQNNGVGLPFARHQLSTDRSTVEFQELSITKNLDFMSYFFKGLLEPFIGVWNVTAETKAAINRSLRAGIAFQEARKYPKIGAALKPGQTRIVSIEEASFDSTRIEVYMNIALPRPLNTIGLHLVV